MRNDKGAKFEMIDGHNNMVEMTVTLGKEACAALKHTSTLLDCKDVPLNHLVSCIITSFRGRVLQCSEEEKDIIYARIKRT